MKSVIAANALLIAVITTGCQSLLPTDNKRSESVWTNYAQAHAIYDVIVPHQTSMAELRHLGFDPSTTPNVKVLTYVDLLRRFIPNSSITLADVHPDVRQCIQDKTGCEIYELELTVNRDKRHGNALADIFGFVRKSHITGWDIRMLFIVKNDVVVYKLASGEPQRDRFEEKIRPLGPFQELEGALRSIPKGF